MERKRVGGRFVREELEEAGEKDRVVRAPKPKHCRTFTRAKVVEALPEIVKTFVDEAKKGSIAHTKMLTALSGLDKSETPAVKKRRGKSAVAKLLEKMMQEPRSKTESGQSGTS